MKENKEETAIISLGSNIGDREKCLKTAISEIKKFAIIKKKSSIYETEAENYQNQSDFLNQIIVIETKKNPQELLKKLQEIEDKMGRERQIPKGPRNIDLDILFYSNRISAEKNLIIPHPEVHKRKFILLPLLEIEANHKHPLFDKSINELLKQLKSTKTVKLWKKKNLKN